MGQPRQLGLTATLVFCSGYVVSTLSKSRKQVFNVQVAWHPPNTVPTMVHGHAFRIIT